jgi:hypothetical protein
MNLYGNTYATISMNNGITYDIKQAHLYIMIIWTDTAYIYDMTDGAFADLGSTSLGTDSIIAPNGTLVPVLKLKWI